MPILDIKQLTAQDIQKILPHRYPFLLVDRVEKVIPASTSPVGDSIIAYKAVSMGEPFFQGHFPDNPVMPGVLILEALSQVAGFLTYRYIQWSKNSLMYLRGIENAKFRHPVTPGHLMRLEVKTTAVKQKKFWIFEGKAFIEDTLVAEALISAAMIIIKDKEKIK